MVCNVIKADISSELYCSEFAHTLYIRRSGGGYILSAEPEFRRNGTQSFDGAFPRAYKRVQDAKGYSTKMFGSGLVWVNIEENEGKNDQL